MNLKKLLVAGAAALTFAGSAFADPIIPPAVTLNPNGGVDPSTATVSQVVCPAGNVNCVLGQVENSPVGNAFQITITGGTAFFNASIDDSISPPFGGNFSALNFTLFNAANVQLGAGNLVTEVNAILAPGVYTMFVAYTYNNLFDNATSRWSMTLTTAPFRQVPEPGTLALMGLALAGLGLLRRRT